jgi:transcriptional regulator GlxA family with amidase domain
LRQAADRYLADSFAGGTPPHVNEFADLIGLSLSGLSRTFAVETGSTVGAYFKDARIRRAKELLGTTDRSLTEIAHAAGFGTRTTMFRSFRRAVGLTPDEYRSRARAAARAPIVQ